MDENTIFDKVVNENNDYVSHRPKSPEQMAEEKARMQNNDRDKNIAVGLGSGILIGGVSFGLTSMSKNKTADVKSNEKGDEPTPDWLENTDVKISHNVNDTMSFNEAFRVAREEVGSGGVFE